MMQRTTTPQHCPPLLLLLLDHQHPVDAVVVEQQQEVVKDLPEGLQCVVRSKLSPGSVNRRDKPQRHSSTQLSPEEQEIIERVRSSLNMDTSVRVSALSDKIEEEMSIYETEDLLTRVHRPEKVVKAMESYVVFTVCTKTTREEFEESEYSVKRRYNDFLWLRSQLVEKHPLLIIAPLPEKQSLTLDRFDKDFVQYREVALGRFLARLCRHPITSYSKALLAFLTMEPHVFSRHKKGSAGLMSRVTQSLPSVYGSGSYRHAITPSYEHEAMYKDAVKLAEKMSEVERCTHQLSGRQSEYIRCLKSLSSAYDQWSRHETELSTALSALSELFDITHINCQFLVDELVTGVALPFREYYLFSEVIRTNLDRRDRIQYDVEHLSLTLDKVKGARASAGESSSPLTVTVSSGESASVAASVGGKTSESQVLTKKGVLDNRIKRISVEKDGAGDKLEVANLELQADYQRWAVTKKQDIKECIGALATRNINFYESQICSLEAVLQKLREKRLAHS